MDFSSCYVCEISKETIKKEIRTKIGVHGEMEVKETCGLTLIIVWLWFWSIWVIDDSKGNKHLDACEALEKGDVDVDGGGMLIRNKWFWRPKSIPNANGTWKYDNDFVQIIFCPFLRLTSKTMFVIWKLEKYRIFTIYVICVYVCTKIYEQLWASK